MTIEQQTQKKRSRQSAGVLRSQASPQLGAVRRDRVPAHFVQLVLAFPASADQPGAEQFLHMVRNGALCDGELLAQSLTREFIRASDGLEQGDAARVGKRLRH